MHARSQVNAQAMFNLGYMYEHGQGLPFDLHLAKRYYDQALEYDSAAKLPVTLAILSLWIRKNYPDSFLVSSCVVLHSLIYSKVFLIRGFLCIFTSWGLLVLSTLTVLPANILIAGMVSSVFKNPFILEPELELSFIYFLV